MNNYTNQTLDGLTNISANTVYTDELYLNGVLLQSFTGLTGNTGPQGIAGSSSSVFPYRAETILLTPPIADNVIQWNNSVQPSSTTIYISHINQNNVDIDPILNSIEINDSITIQSKSDSTQYQKWVMNSNTAFSTYSSLGVSLITSTYSFAHNDNIDIFFLELESRVRLDHKEFKEFKEFKD